MKTEKRSFGNSFSKKRFALGAIAIVLCSVLLAALPAAIAAEQASGAAEAPEGNYILKIYGNANEDNTIDMRDFTFTARIILGLEEETALADANYDGEVTVLDMTQIGLIILGRERELTLIDSANRTVTISKPVERVVIAYWIDAAMTLQALKAEDTVVGFTEVVVDEPILFPELSGLPSVGSGPIPDALDYEKILELEPDVVFTGGTSMDPTSYEEIIKRIRSLDPSIQVICFTFCAPSLYTEEVKKTGYLFDRSREADELIDFFEEHLNEIEETVSDIPEDERAEVYTEFFWDYYTSGEGSVFSSYIETAGGKNVFDDLPSYGDYYLVEVDPEEVIRRNPEVMLFHAGMSIVTMGYQTDDVTALRDKRENIMNRDGFANVDAVDSGRVYTCHSNIILSAIYPVGVAYYAKWFYPEKFSELDPNAIHQEYLDRFMRIDYDLDEHGVFVYHPEKHPNGR